MEEPGPTRATGKGSHPKTLGPFMETSMYTETQHRRLHLDGATSDIKHREQGTGIHRQDNQTAPIRNIIIQSL